MTECEIFTWTKEGKPNTPMVINRVGWHNAVGLDGPVKVPLFDESAFDWLIATQREHIQDGYDSPYIVTGDRRRGKSVFVLKMSRRHCNTFTVENVHFAIEPFMANLEAVEEADPRLGYYPIVDYDESITGLHNQEWQSQVPYVKVLNIIGKKRITMPIVLPHLSDLNPKVTRMMSFWIYIFERGIAEIRVPRANQFNKDIFWIPFGAIRYTAFPEDDPFWLAYQARKDTFIEEYTKDMSNTEAEGGRAGKYAGQRNKLIRYIIDNDGKQIKDVADIIGEKANTVTKWLVREKPKVVV